MSIFGNLFKWKSAADIEREQALYEKWAFPHGEKQRDNLKSLLKTIFNDDEGFVLFAYLMCKEMYEKAKEDSGSRDLAIDKLVNDRKESRLQLIKQLKQKDWLLYIALVLADENVNESCEYPAADMIMEKAQELNR